MNKNGILTILHGAGKCLLLLAILTIALGAGSSPAAQAPETTLVLVEAISPTILSADLRVLERYDAFVLAEVPLQDLPEIAKQPGVDPLPRRTVVSLNGTVFDTRRGEPSFSAELRSAPGDPYFLVQFYGPVKTEWIANLEKMGVTFLGYHPNYTYIVRMTPSLVSQVRNAHAVEWVGPYHPAYRLASEEEMKRAFSHEGQIALWVRGFPGEDPAALRGQLEQAGYTVELFSATAPASARVWAEPQQLGRLASLNGVYRVEPYDPPEVDNERAAQVMHTWDVWRASRNGLLQDLMGAGQIAGAVDSGLDNNTTSPTIQDFYDFTNGGSTSRVIYNGAGDGCGGFCNCYSSDDANSSGHGTHVAGSIVGNGYNSLQQRSLTAQATGADPSFDYAWGVGQAPEAQLAFAHVSGRIIGIDGTLCGLGTTYNTWLNVYNAGARNVNNSWGNATYTYGGDAMSGDRIMWERQDYLVVTSASNDGPGWNTVAQPGTGKNILTVGASLHHRPAWGLYGDTASQLIYFSSRGPVNLSGGDGRAKPDIVAPGSQVLSTRTNAQLASYATLWGNEPGDGDGDGRPDYAWSGGTSMAAPLATGAATLIRDYLVDIQNLSTPSAALVKAMLLNGAVDMGYGYESLGSAPYGGRNLQGWGMVNVEQSILPHAPRSFFFDDLTNITGSQKQSSIGFTASGQWKEYTVDVVDSSEPLKVTLHWTDYQTGADGFAVNNLDLLVTAPDSTEYRGNVFSGSWSTTGGSYDDKNNVEAVYVKNPAPGTWTIRITDQAHGNGTQPYVLVAAGGLGPDPAYTRSDTRGRAGTSALPYFPSLKPLTGGPEHVEAGNSFEVSFRLTNWGTTADTLNLSYSVTDMKGNSAAGVTVTFSPGSSFSLASGSSQDIEATISVGAAVGDGPYDVEITASEAGGHQNGLVLPLNVILDSSLPNETRVVDPAAPQFASDLWGTGDLLWAAYLSAENSNNSEAEVWTSRSTDGGLTWTSMGQVDADDGIYYHEPALAGNSDGTSVTVAWVKPHSNVYARTWTAGSGWGSIRTLASYGVSEWRLGRPDVIYDNEGDILIVWRAYDYATAATLQGIFSSWSTDNGASWSAAAGVPDASSLGGLHYQPQLTLDTSRNDVWMAYAHNTNNRDIRLKRWAGDTYSWQTGNPVVAGTTDRELRPGIGYVAATDSLWITWHRYANWSNPTARLYYRRATQLGSSPDFGTIYGPYGTRTSESLPATVTGDAAQTFIAYQAYDDTYRGNNVHMLAIPAIGGTPSQIAQISATVDDPPLYARGNAGNPQLLWLQTTVNGQTATGPTLLYSKNAPDSGDPNYGDNLGTAQTLFDLEENFGLYLSQVGAPLPTSVGLGAFTARANGPAIVLEWETLNEINILGFNLYRSGAPEGRYDQINPDLISALGSGLPLGAIYTETDTLSYPRITYHYKLEAVHLIGPPEWLGPVTATVTSYRTFIYLPVVTMD